MRGSLWLLGLVTLTEAAPVVVSVGALTLVADVASQSAFRLGVRFGQAGDTTTPLATPMLDASAVPAPSWPVTRGAMTGAGTAFGSLLVGTDGSWELLDASNRTLVASAGPPAYSNVSNATVDAGITLPVMGTAAANGTVEPCLGNGVFGPPFYYNRAAGYFALGVADADFDPDYTHCYPVEFDGHMGAHGAAAAPDVCSQAVRQNQTDVTNAQRSPTHPGGAWTPDVASCCGLCQADPLCYSWVYGPGDPTGNCWPLANYSATVSAVNRTFGGGHPPQPPWYSVWWAMGEAADWYLAPAAAPLAFTKALYDLTGPPAVPPYYAMGFMATYWGFETMEYVEGNMTAFRDGAYPIDTMIMDYDWWMTAGNPNLDFDYDPVMFGHHDFIHPTGSVVPNATTDGPVELFDHFQDDINFHWAGIRKPRSYNHVDLSNASGWLLPDSFNVGAGGNNWNMTAPGWEPWYAGNHTHFLADGVSFWWNDEGETQFFTYHWWNEAQSLEYAMARPGERMFTINRAFTPGMQRFPAISWTGDRQDCAHSTVLQFTVAGQLYTACDMTAPNADVLVRQYWNAVFLPIMRVHAMHGVPRFPYYWGGPEHWNAFRAALNTRYVFIPHLYSLAHAARATGAPIALPASYVLPVDSSFPQAVADATYMVGDCLLPADVSTANSFDPNVNVTVVNIPPGVWYAFNSTAAVVGPTPQLTETDVPLDKLVLYVRAGAILTLQSAVVQFTGAIGGQLTVQVYAGRNGAFTLVEDDGIRLDYVRDPASCTRSTAFVWDDASRLLSWTVSGAFAGGANTFTSMVAVLFVANASQPVPSEPAALGTDGSIQF